MCKHRASTVFLLVCAEQLEILLPCVCAALPGHAVAPAAVAGRACGSYMNITANLPLHLHTLSTAPAASGHYPAAYMGLQPVPAYFTGQQPSIQQPKQLGRLQPLAQQGCGVRSYMPMVPVSTATGWCAVHIDHMVQHWIDGLTLLKPPLLTHASCCCSLQPLNQLLYMWSVHPCQHMSMALPPCPWT